jgi:carboxylesterase type B
MGKRSLWGGAVGMAILAALPIAVAAAAQSAPVVETNRGLVRGATADGVEEFLGIPYAAPPVGPLRWRAPQPAAAWTGERDASKFGSACPQKSSGDSRRVTDEDCLFVNVERPAGAGAASKLPVYVDIYGGNFIRGSSNNEDPYKIVHETGVIAVTFNYRLGVFGFLSHPALAETPGGPSGNYGFLDQQAALRWVQQNIARFGGDPTRVTIGGESAGGISVCGHLVSPGSRGLFAQAIIQSGSCKTYSRSEAEHAGLRIALALMCPDPQTAAACLRGKSADELLDSPDVFYRFVRGTSAFPEDPNQAIASGNFALVPLIIGSTRHETRTFLPVLDFGMSQGEYVTHIRQLLGSKADAVLAQYPWPTDATPATGAYLVSDISTDSGSFPDGIGGCASLSLTQEFAKYVKTYAYEWEPPVTGPSFFEIPGYDWGDAHATEMSYLFPRRNGGVTAAMFGAGQQQLSRDLIQYWGGFVKGGQPAGRGLAAWPLFADGGTFMSLRIAGGSQTITNAAFRAEHRCAFWDSLPGQSDQ